MVGAYMQMVWNTIKEIMKDVIEDGEKLFAIMRMIEQFEEKYKNIYEDREQLKEEIEDIVLDMKILVDTIYFDLR